MRAAGIPATEFLPLMGLEDRFWTFARLANPLRRVNLCTITRLNYGDVFYACNAVTVDTL